MSADIVLKEHVIELVDTRLVRIGDDDGEAVVGITGRLRVTGTSEAEELGAQVVHVGTGAAGEPRPPGELTLRDEVGNEIVRIRHVGEHAWVSVGSQDTPGRITVRSGDGDVRIGGGVVHAPEGRIGAVDTGELRVGVAAPGEPPVAGILRIENEGQTATIELRAGADVPQQPSILVRLPRLSVPEISRFRLDDSRLRIGSGMRAVASDGTRDDIEEEEVRHSRWEYVELDLVQEVLFLRQQVKDLLDRVSELENRG